jgi:hypothetical protein
VQAAAFHAQGGTIGAGATSRAAMSELVTRLWPAIQATARQIAARVI